MFSKNVSWMKLKSRSIVNKLILLYSASTIGLIAAVFLFLYPSFSQLLHEHKTLHSSLHHGIEEKKLLIQENKLTIECFKKSILALLLSALLAILLGNFIARNGLKRLKEFTALMEKITVRDLHERLNLNDWPKELKNLGKTFNTMLDRIEKSFVQLSQFSQDLAHELRSPINNLRLMTEVSLTKKHLAPEHRPILESYLEEYEFLSQLIENLLFLARNDSGQTIINKQSINIKDEILKICEFYKAVADEKQIEFICEGDHSIMADALMFKRVINNLLSNSLRHSYFGSKIFIKIASEHQFGKIIITDTGEGIEESHLAKIMDRFYRVDLSRSTQSGGLGLGLAIVKSIMDLHKGTIQVKSMPSQGTSVFLQFPQFN